MISFLVVYLAPGKPSQVDPLNPKFTPEMVERFRKQFHLDEPLYTQYVYFYAGPLDGHSVSWKDSEPVLGKMWDRVKNSLLLFFVGTILTWTLSFPIGIRSALFRGGIYDRSVTFLSYFLISIPGFFFAYILIILVVEAFHVPVIGMKTFGLGECPLVPGSDGQGLASSPPFCFGCDRRDRDPFALRAESDARGGEPGLCQNGQGQRAS